MPELRETTTLPVKEPVWIVVNYRNGSPKSSEFERRLELLPGEYAFKALNFGYVDGFVSDGNNAVAIIIYGTSPTPTLLTVRATLGASTIAMFDEVEVPFSSVVGAVTGAWHSVTGSVGETLDPIKDRIDELVGRGMATSPDAGWEAFCRMLKSVWYVGLGVGGLALFIRLMQATARKRKHSKKGSASDER